jgi:hypothetical protein
LEITLFCAGWAVRLGKQTIDFLRNGKPLSVKRCNMICNFESHQVFFYGMLPIEIFSYFQPWLASSCAEKIEKLDILLKINKKKRRHSKHSREDDTASLCKHLQQGTNNSRRASSEPSDPISGDGNLASRYPAYEFHWISPGHDSC